MVKVLSLFTGIGAFEKALDNLGIKYELVNYSEIDKFASRSYCAIHNVDESLNLGDITKINEKELPCDIDLITYGYPLPRY
jgi:DNA (cytosine-5)-methyltransferase 1